MHVCLHKERTVGYVNTSNVLFPMTNEALSRHMTNLQYHTEALKLETVDQFFAC